MQSISVPDISRETGLLPPSHIFIYVTWVARALCFPQFVPRCRYRDHAPSGRHGAEDVASVSVRYVVHSRRMLYSDSYLFETANGLYPEAASLRQYNTQIHKSRAQYIYHIHTNVHITQNNTTKKKQNKEKKSTHKATETVNNTLQPMNRA
jgi:hypothetical protein